MTVKNTREEMCHCPVGTFFKDVERIIGKKSDFMQKRGTPAIEVPLLLSALAGQALG